MLCNIEGIIWVGIGNMGLIALMPESAEFKTYTLDDTHSSALSNNSILDITDDENGNIWACSYGGGINVFNKKENKFTYILHKTNNYNSLISDLTYGIIKGNKGEFWIATEYGLSNLNYFDTKFRNYKHDNCELNSLSDNRIRTIFFDSNNILWIGTESGVDKLVQQNDFLLFKNNPNKRNSIPRGIVRTILEDNNENVWVGLIEKGLTKYSPKTDDFKSYKHFISVTHKNAGKHVTALFQDEENNIWLGEWDSGLFKYNSEIDNFVQVLSASSEKNALSDNRIQKIMSAEPGFLWIGTESGINYFEIKNNQCVQFLHNPNDPNSLSANGVQSNAMAMDAEGNLWVGVWSGGLNKIAFKESSKVNPEFKVWKSDPKKINGLSSNNVIALHFDKQGILWIGTFGGGLNRFDTKTGLFRNYTTVEGLPNNIVFSILDDHNGNLWLSTDGGLSKFDPQTEMFQNFYESDGLQSDHFFWGASNKGKSGQIYLGGINGFNSFYPDSLNQLKLKPNIVLTGLKIFNEEIPLRKAISVPEQIELSFEENFLTFEFVALNYFHPNRQHYRYKMDGMDKNWNLNDDRRFASYTNLAPGTYTFRVQTSKNIRQWESNELSVKIIIHPPWWASLWARLIQIFIIVGGVLAFYFIRVGILQRQKRKLEAQVIARTAEINKSKLQLEEQKEQISSQNQVLLTQKNELGDKNTELSQTLEQLEITQKALIESEKMASIGIMSAGIAHEINNPLNFISVSLENIKIQISEQQEENDLFDEGRMQIINKLLEHSDTGINRITNITNSLKIYAYKGDGVSKLVDVKDLIESSVTILHSKIPEYVKIELNFSVVPKVLCKADQISQVILNLIDNAIDAITEKPQAENEQIIIDTSEIKLDDKNCILIDISNTGGQINEKNLKHLFDPFFTTKAPNKGTGLGLYISYNIIHDHKGKLKVKNISNGVKFSIFLPLGEV